MAQATRSRGQAARMRGGDGGRPRAEKAYRVLVVANEAVDSATARAIGKRADGRTVSAWVVAPALASRLKEGLGDVDAGIERAQERLAASLATLEGNGVEARGEVGDVDPQVAIEDALRKFEANDVAVDEVIVASPEGEGAERIHEDAIHEVEDGEPGGEVSQGGNWPRMTLREQGTILVGVTGTLVLLMLALLCPEQGNVDTGCAARVLIALGAFLISIWHIVGLVFFESVRYRGGWERFAEGLVLAGIPVAVAASLIVG